MCLNGNKKTNVGLRLWKLQQATRYVGPDTVLSFRYCLTRKFMQFLFVLNTLAQLIPRFTLNRKKSVLISGQ